MSDRLSRDAGIPQRARSAGTELVDGVNPLVAEAMLEVSIGISGAKPSLMQNDMAERRVVGLAENLNAAS